MFKEIKEGYGRDKCGRWWINMVECPREIDYMWLNLLIVVLTFLAGAAFIWWMVW